MAIEFKTVAIVGRFQDSRVAEPMSALARHLTKAGADVVTSDELPADFAARRISRENFDGVWEVMGREVSAGEVSGRWAPGTV